VAAEEDFDLETTYIVSTASTDYANNIQTCLDSEYDAVITVGFLMTDDTLAAAEANPEVYFIGIDQGYEAAPENLVGVQYREDQSGFLAGAMAALMTESNIIAGVYGIPVPAVLKFQNGYEQGAKYINPDIDARSVFIQSFTDPAAGAEAAEQLVAEGADVIFGAGGQTGSGAIRRAAELGASVIGVDQDEYYSTFGSGEVEGVENLISSAMKRVDQGVYLSLQALA
jgi:basic membrane lipoprotein Med (substrate-binding protein (PBP1-ABC) superfamily)